MCLAILWIKKVRSNMPTGSLSTTAGLAACVFIAVPLYGVMHQGLTGYLRHYLQPSLFMLPFNIIGEFSRTLSLAVRLFGNAMSGHMIVAILISIVPLLFPIIMQVFGLLTGLIQAYIFAVLAIGSIAPALGEGRAVASALAALAQQPDESNTITRTLFVSLTMIESTGIYWFVVSMILLFANPFWEYFLEQAGG